MLSYDEVTEVRSIVRKIDSLLIDLEYVDIDIECTSIDYSKVVDTLKITKTSYLNFVEELSRAIR